MALDNKKNNHSESQQYIYVQATIQKGTIPLLSLLLQKRHPSDFAAMTQKRQKRLQELPRLESWAWHYAVQLFIVLRTRKPRQDSFRCKHVERFSLT